MRNKPDEERDGGVAEGRREDEAKAVWEGK
jgi:hypothetical protein